MKTIAKLLLAATLLATTIAAEARGSRGSNSGSGSRAHSSYCGGSSRSGYVYRNPYAAHPSVSVRGYSKNSGTFVPPHVHTPANDSTTDNLTYRGYGTIRVPRD